MSKTATFFEQWEKDLHAMREESPADVQGFGDLFQSAMSEGVLTSREKELITLCIGLAIRCSACTKQHVEQPFEVEGTLRQILKAAGAAVVMPDITNNRSRFGLAARYRIPQDTNKVASRPGQ